MSIDVTTAIEVPVYGFHGDSPYPESMTTTTATIRSDATAGEPSKTTTIKVGDEFFTVSSLEFLLETAKKHNKMIGSIYPDKT